MAKDYDKQTDDGAMQCANHPQTTTYIRCSRCDKPICTRCMHATPVGYRCADCFNPQVSATYKVDPSKLPAAIGGGLAVAAVGGVLWGFFPQFAFWIVLITGFIMGDVIGRLSNEKRGPTLQYAALGSAAASFVIALITYSLTSGNGIASVVSAIGRFNFSGRPIFDTFQFLLLGLLGFMVWARLR